MALQRGEGIVLRTKPFSESDLIIEHFFARRGRRSLICKGARGSRSKHGGVFDTLNRVEVVFYEKPGLDLVSQASLIRDHGRLKGDLKTVTETLRVARLLDLLLPPHQPEDGAFVVLDSLLCALEEAPDAPESRCLAAQLKLLATLGHRPQLAVCSRCGEERGPFSFSAADGGIVCTRCIAGNGVGISRGLARSLERLLEHPLERARVLRLRPEDAAAAQEVLDTFVERLARGG
jgi:DNA repair protein RecO (recombination protein O)